MRAQRWMIASVAALSLCACKTDLLVGLSQRQANEAIALLQRHEIQANKLPDGKKAFKVAVETDQFADAVRLLSQYHLPSREDITIADMFPADSLVTSPMSERARMLSGIEQRLEKTVGGVERVVSARVHVSYPIHGLDTRQKSPMRVAIVVNYEGELQENLFAEKLKRLARNSFEGLAYENISVVLFQHHDANSVILDTARGKSGSFWSTLLAVLGGLLILGLGWQGWRRFKASAEAPTAPALELDIKKSS